MSFIATLIALGLLQYWGSATPLHNDSWFEQWQQRCMGSSENPLWQIVLAVGLPCLLLGLVLALFGGWIWGLVELALSVTVLMYAFGRGEFNEKVEEYCAAWREGRHEKLPVVIQAVDPGYVPHVEEGVQRTHVAARDSFLYAGFARLFVVLFWFVLLGPVAALAYRLICLMQRSNDLMQLQMLRDLMEWPAGRLMGITFAFVGDFGRAVGAWLSAAMNFGMTTRQVIANNAMAALDQNMSWLTGKFEETNSLAQQAKLAEQELKDIQQLLSRSLVFAVVVVAIYQILI